jgi:hypothetical protein
VQLRAVPDDRKTVAAQTIGDRLDDHDRGGRCNGSVHGVTALQEHPQARLGGKRLGRGDNVTRK